MRIETSGDYAWRTDLYDEVGDRLSENTRSGAVDGACEFTREMLGNLERAVKHPDMTEEFAEVLSTRAVNVEYRVETGIGDALFSLLLVAESLEVDAGDVLDEALEKYQSRVAETGSASSR